MDALENIHLPIKSKNIKSKLCREVEKVLNDLRENSLIIKESYKGSGVVVMNKDYYKKVKSHKCYQLPVSAT